MLGAMRLCRVLFLTLGLLRVEPSSSAAVRQQVAVESEASAPGLANLRRSVFRISVYKRLFHWSRPFDNHDVSGSLGSAFLISLDPLMICTCAHVVAGAEVVFLQVTEFGRTRFPVKVATIDYDTDAAILVLVNPAFLLDKLSAAGIELVPLQLAKLTPPLGQTVVAPGFPLGQESLTLSTGVISGVDHVDFHHRNLALQSTAIISPGNSGSPLLDAESHKVIGMNYAKLSGEAQINYAVALWRLQQVIKKHKEVYTTQKNRTELYQLKLVDHGLVTTAGLDVLYMMRANGTKTCDSGPLISDIYPDSPFRDAVPPVIADSFLVSVDGVKLDRYGQGSKNNFVKELVDFDDLMMMRGGTGDEGILVETCDGRTGEVLQHNVSLAWRAERQGAGIRYIHDARLDKVSWEIFEDLLFMDLTQNHIDLAGDSTLYHYREPEARQNSRLAVFLIKEGGNAQEALGLSEGYELAIVETVNGHPVKNIQDLRLHFIPQAANSSREVVKSNLTAKNATKPALLNGRYLRGDALEQEHEALLTGQEMLWSMRTRGGKEYAALFKQTLKQQADSGLEYMLTSAAKAAMEKLGFLSSGSRPEASLLGAQTRRREDLQPPSKFGAEPLESVRRSGGNVVVDFVHGEGFNVW